MTILEVDGLRVDLAASGTPIVEDLSLTLRRGEILGLVGESGCGKSTVAMAMMGYERRGVRISAGSVRLDGTDVLALPERDRRALRGARIAYVPQDPATALNPGLRLRRQLVEPLQAHGVGADPAERLDLVRQRLAEVNLPATDEFLNRYPHQISGGQQQRVAIAIAFACLPAVIVCDEPTTGLDVSTQGYVLDTIRRLSSEHGVGTVYVSHDLAVVSELATTVKVMYSGRIIESAPVLTAFQEPRHPYTAALVSAVPRLDERTRLVSITGTAPRPAERGSGCAFAPRCSRAQDDCTRQPPPSTVLAADHSVRCLHPLQGPLTLSPSPVDAVDHGADARTPVLAAENLTVRYGDRTVLHGADLEVHPGRCLAVVGESGSGKSTTSRTLAGLVSPSAGRTLLDGVELAGSARQRTKDQRKKLQIIFQNPYASLNPRRTIGDSVGAPARFIFGDSRKAALARAEGALEQVALNPRLLHAFPDQLSGGERQRAAIARALICEPEVLICDEVTSALDVSIQASIVNLLIRLKQERGLGLLFVTHNLPLAAALAESTLVLYQGTVVENGPTDRILRAPEHDYTRSLLRDTPQPQFS